MGLGDLEVLGPLVPRRAGAEAPVDDHCLAGDPTSTRRWRETAPSLPGHPGCRRVRSGVMFLKVVQNGRVPLEYRSIHAAGADGVNPYAVVAELKRCAVGQ